MQIAATRTYLALTPDAHRPPARELPPELRLVRQEPGAVARYRELYTLVGSDWHWRDRHAWSDEHLYAHLASPDVTVWELLAPDDAIVGYVELARHDADTTEILYFGLAPGWTGRGIGGAFLSRAIDLAWAAGAKRVTLNTCTLDSPHALPNYLARGFQIERVEEYVVEDGQ